MEGVLSLFFHFDISQRKATQRLKHTPLSHFEEYNPKEIVIKFEQSKSLKHLIPLSLYCYFPHILE